MRSKVGRNCGTSGAWPHLRPGAGPIDRTVAQCPNLPVCRRVRRFFAPAGCTPPSPNRSGKKTTPRPRPRADCAEPCTRFLEGRGRGPAAASRADAAARFFRGEAGARIFGVPAQSLRSALMRAVSSRQTPTLLALFEGEVAFEQDAKPLIRSRCVAHQQHIAFAGGDFCRGQPSVVACVGAARIRPFVS